MVTIDNLRVTVTVEAGQETDAAFDRMFARAIDRWWATQQRAAQREVRLDAARRTGVGGSRG